MNEVNFYTDNFEKLRPKLEYYIRKTFNNIPLQEIPDLIQDVSIKAYKNNNKYSSELGTYSSWLFKLARNTCIDYLRKNKNNNSLPLEEKSNNIPTEDFSSENYDVKYMMSVIEKLPSNLCVIFNLLLEGYKYEEIAEATGIPVNTVKCSIFRTRKLLQKKLNLKSPKTYKNE